MKKLIMCEGLPGSGKSTWAQGQVERNRLKQWRGIPQGSEPGPYDTVVVNKDSIRRELEATGWVWSQKNEAEVVEIRDSRIVQAFTTGAVVVISDDTNLGRKHRMRLRELAQMVGATFERKSFLDVPVEECIRRDAGRTGKARVGEQVILRMAAQYRIAVPEKPRIPVQRDGSLMSAIICDLDGTLALMGDRSPFDASTCDQDAVNLPVRKLLEVFYRFMNYQIIYLSGREDKYRPQTESFFRKHHIPPGPLHMRATGDFRRDYIVKGELFDAHVRDRYNVLFVLDDRTQVVKYWRSIGLTCLQVAEGDF